MHMPLEDTLGLNLLAANDHQAEHNREHFDAWRLLCLNVMSSPGAGKTSLLKILIGQYQATSGTVKIGPLTKFNYVDQSRLQLREDRTVRALLESLE